MNMHWLDVVVIVGAVALLAGVATWAILAVGLAGQAAYALWWAFRRTMLGAVVAQWLDLKPLSEVQPGDPRYQPPKQ